MKAISVRMPDEILDWLREKAAMETIKRKKLFSINGYIVEILRKEMETEKEKGRVIKWVSRSENDHRDQAFTGSS
jgi:hypothetical protein